MSQELKRVKINGTVGANVVAPGDVVGDPKRAWVQSTAEEYIDSEIEKVKNWVSNTPVTDVSTLTQLPASGEANTLYRVAGTNTYSEYGWDGTQFVKLDEKEYGIDDVPVADSENLVKSGGVSNKLYLINSKLCGKTTFKATNWNILNNNKTTASSGSAGLLITLSGFKVNKIRIIAGNYQARIAFIKSIPSPVGSTVEYATGENLRLISLQNYLDISSIPNDAVYLFVGTNYIGNESCPQNIFFDDYDIFQTLEENYKWVNERVNYAYDNFNYPEVLIKENYSFSSQTQSSFRQSVLKYNSKRGIIKVTTNVQTDVVLGYAVYDILGNYDNKRFTIRNGVYEIEVAYENVISNIIIGNYVESQYMVDAIVNLYYVPKDNQFLDVLNQRFEELDILESNQRGIFIGNVIDTINGEALQLFFDSIFVYDKGKYDIRCRCSKGHKYENYFELTPSAVGNTALELYLVSYDKTNPEGNVCSSVNLSINVVNPPTTVNINKILMIGDSFLMANTIPNEVYRRFVGVGGTPVAFNLTNTEFVGRLITSSGARYEATSGYSYKSYSIKSSRQFKFFVNNVSECSINDVYRCTSTSGTNINLVVSEVNLTGGTGYIKMLFQKYDNKTQNFNTSGTLTKISGIGDSSITYNNLIVDDYSPFIDDSGDYDFTSYINTYCGGSVTHLVIELGTNDIQQLIALNVHNKEDIEENYPYIKNFIQAFHSEYPNAKVVVTSPIKCSTRGGESEINKYNDSFVINNLVLIMGEYMKDLAESLNYVTLCDVNAQFDAIHGFPTIEKAVNTRSDIMETVENNSVHPNESGYLQYADALVRTIAKVLN